MKLYQTYKKIVSLLKPVKLAWFTTFNLDPELIEKFLLPCIVDKEPSDLVTAEDFEALNVELQDRDRNIDIRVWYDYRALNLRNNKRTTIDLFPVDPRKLYKINKTDAIFHPKVIFLKGVNEAYIITGSANLSISAWSSNCESVIVKKIDNQRNANEIISFFNLIGADTSKLRKEVSLLNNKKSDWQFIYSLNNNFNLFNYLDNGNLSIWSPYFSKSTNEFLNSLQKQGYKKITVIPDVSESGKIHILSDELELLQNNTSVSLCKSAQYDEKQQLHHAKVWLTPGSLAVGSWNCTHRATGLDISEPEKNVEAGIVIKSDPSIEKKLQAGLGPHDFNNISGLKQNQMDEEWEKVLSPYTFCINIIADWNKFIYVLDTDNFENKFTVSLPDNQNEKVLLKNVNGLSFLKNYRKVLKDKIFTVYDDSGKEIFKGYLREIGKSERPVFGYASLSDLLDSLIDNPLGETPLKHCQYRLQTEEGISNEGYHPPPQYSGSESYYSMFVCFQKLLDNIENISGEQEKLDNLGFRLPGSIINIIQLVDESLQKALEENNQDSLLYHYFLVCEVNSCVNAFNENYEGKKIDLISFDRLKILLGFSQSDEKFLNKIKKAFGYVNV